MGEGDHLQGKKWKGPLEAMTAQGGPDLEPETQGQNCQWFWF